MHLLKLNIALIMLMLTLSGCMGLSSSGARDQIELGKEYATRLETDQDANSDSKWWLLFDDAELNMLIEHAFINNPDINQIKARLAQAQAITAKSAAPLLPSLNISGERGASEGDNPPPSDYALKGAASFEIDLWGKNQATYKSSKLQQQASENDLYAAAITLSASIVENWLDILSLLEQEAIIRKQMDINGTILKLQKKRFEMGSSSALDFLQQQEILAKTEALLPDILSAQEQSVNNITALIGETPNNSMYISEKPLPAALPVPNAGLPSELITNRPDIIAAWLRLRSADWVVKAAWRDRLPSFNLSANYLTNASKLSGLFDTWLLDMVAGLTAPILDGGSRRAEHIRSKALADERYHNYRGVVLAAVLEVENAMIKNKYQDNKILSLTKQLNASKNTLGQAQLSYINGKNGYINVLSSLNNVQALEQKITVERLVQAKERVKLYRALGGNSWLDLEFKNGKGEL